MDPMTTPMWGLAALVGLLSIAAQILMTVALHQEDAAWSCRSNTWGSDGVVRRMDSVRRDDVLDEPPGHGACGGVHRHQHVAQIEVASGVFLISTPPEAEPKRRHSGDQRQDRPRGRVGNPPHVEGHPQSHQGSKC